MFFSLPFIIGATQRDIGQWVFLGIVAALVVVPMVLRLPVEQALPTSLFIVVAWLIVTLPLSLASLRSWTWRAGWLACIAAAPWLIWMSRSQIPAAGPTAQAIAVRGVLNPRVTRQQGNVPTAFLVIQC